MPLRASPGQSRPPPHPAAHAAQTPTQLFQDGPSAAAAYHSSGALGNHGRAHAQGPAQAALPAHGPPSGEAGGRLVSGSVAAQNGLVNRAHGGAAYPGAQHSAAANGLRVDGGPGGGGVAAQEVWRRCVIELVP